MNTKCMVSTTYKSQKFGLTYYRPFKSINTASYHAMIHWHYFCMKHFIIVGNIFNISDYLHIYYKDIHYYFTKTGISTIYILEHLEKHGGWCSLCGVWCLLVQSACNLNPLQPIPASPLAILLPEAPGTCLTKNGKNRQMEMNAGKF